MIGRTVLGRVLGVLSSIWVFWLVAGTGAAEARRAADYLPNVVLATQDGQKVRFYNDVIKDKTVVFSFIYTSCMDICPLITARMAQVYAALGEAAGRDIHFESISTDPKNDTPERLKRHADAFRADPRWLFLTGTVADIDHVRYKLGERSRKITEQGSQIIIYNDRTGEWLRDSAFGDIGVLAVNIRRMDPVVRAQPVAVEALPAPAAPVTDQPGQALFAKACASCHAIRKGAKVGPNLAGVTEHGERGWLINFICAPGRMHRDKDPIALELAAQYPNVRMPSLQLSESDTADLLTYIDARSYALEAADMKGPHRRV